MLSVNVLYAHTSGDNLMRGLNLNAPIDGVRARIRPSPTSSQVLGDAESRAEHVERRRHHQLQRTATPGPADR